MFGYYLLTLPKINDCMWVVHSFQFRMSMSNALHRVLSFTCPRTLCDILECALRRIFGNFQQQFPSNYVGRRHSIARDPFTPEVCVCEWWWRNHFYKLWRATRGIRHSACFFKQIFFINHTPWHTMVCSVRCKYLPVRWFPFKFPAVFAVHFDFIKYDHFSIPNKYNIHGATVFICGCQVSQARVAVSRPTYKHANKNNSEWKK